MKRVHKPMPLGKRVAWLFSKKGLPALVALLVGVAIGWFVNGAVGLILSTVAGLLIMFAFKKRPVRVKPWQALVTDISPIVAKMCFMMIILLPVMDYMTLPTGQTPDTLTKYVSILLALPKNLISGAPATDVFPGIPVVVLLSVVLMVWGSMNLGRVKMWVIALCGLLLFTFSPSIAAASHGHPNLRLDFSFYSIGYFIAWFGIIWMMVSRILPKILKTGPAKKSAAAGVMNVLPPIVIAGLLTQHAVVNGSGFHLPLFGSFDFESLHHGIAAGFSAGFAGLGGAAITEQEGYEDGEEPEEEFGGNEAPPEEDVPEPEPDAPAGPQPSTDPEDPPGTTIETDKDGNLIKRTPDGVVGTKYTDGTTYIVAKDGTSETTYPDGTTKSYSPEDGLEVKHPNGDIETTLPDGRTGGVKNNPDGTMDITSPYGGTLHVPKSGEEGYPEGSLTKADGTQFGCQKDGSVFISTPGGTMTMDPDGNMSGEMTTPEGDRIVAKPDGTIEMESPNGDKITLDEEGLKAKFGDGSHLNMDSDGNITSAHIKDPDGTLDISTDSKGMHIKDDQGNSADVGKDGSVEMKGADGSTASADSQGNATVTDGKGTTWSAKSDGSGAIFDKKGNRIDLHKDGSLTVKESNGKTTTYTADQVGQMKAQAGGAN